MKNNINRNEAIPLSVSFRIAEGHRDHNLRESEVPHADKTRADDNVFFMTQTVEQAFEEVFGEVDRLYMEKNPQIMKKGPYLERVKKQYKDKKDQILNREILVMIGNEHDIETHPELWPIMGKCLSEYLKGFVNRNPYFYVYCAALHMDEATPHIHLMVIPFRDGYDKGMQRQCSLEGALQMQRFKKTSELFAFEVWRNSELDEIERIMNVHGLAVAPGVGVRHIHQPIERYKAMMENLDNRVRAQESLLKDVFHIGKHVFVRTEDFEKFEELAKVYQTHHDLYKGLCTEVDTVTKECNQYLKYLAGQSDILQEKRAELENSLERLKRLEKENASLQKELEAEKQHRINYARRFREVLESEGTATRERDESDTALAEMTKAVSMLIDPNARGYEIEDLDVRSRNILTAIASRGKRTLQKHGKDLDADVEHSEYNLQLPDGINQELYRMMRCQEEEWER